MDRDLPLYDVQLARLRDLKRQQRLRRLIYFRLESDSMPNRASPTDLWIPKLRKYESTPEGTVQHLDEISMWRNLSPAQAKEILFWEKMLAAVLEYIVSNHLIDMIDELGLENHFAEPDTISRIICAFVNSVGCRTFAVDIQEVITSMIELFGIHGSQHHWLASCGDFRNGLCEFLRTRDCFLDTPVSPTVKVSFSASMNHRGEPTVCGQMKRYGPHVSFSRLDSQVFLDRSCHVHPVFVDPILNIGYNARVGYPEYDLKSDCVEFGWSPLHDGFVGFLRNGRIKHSTQPTPKVFDLTATGTRLFPEGVKFERTIRLKINVTVHQEHHLPEPPSYESFQTSSYQSPDCPVDDISSLMRTRKRGSEFRQNTDSAYPAGIRGGALGANAQSHMMNSSSMSQASGTRFEQNYLGDIGSDVESCRPGYWDPEQERELIWQQQLSQWQRRLEKKPALRRSSSESRIRTLPTRSSNIAFDSSQHSSNATVCYSGSSKASKRIGGKATNGDESLSKSDASVWAEIQRQADRVEDINALVEAALQPHSNASGSKRPLKSNDRVRRRSQSCGPPHCDEKRLKFVQSNPPDVALSVDQPHKAQELQVEPHTLQVEPQNLCIPGALPKLVLFGAKSSRKRRNRQSRREDSACSESSQATAIQTHETAADEEQAEIKEFYDTMLFKRQYEQSVPFRRQTIGEKSDEDAFEDAFREAGTDFEDYDAEE
ncbi:hypothetical protein IWZ01DRAFT_343316 [Phyllosticta capitalensis]